MTRDNLITAEMKIMIGQETNLPSIEVIDKVSIIRYAQAISDLNPLYFDEECAKKTKYGGIIAPATFIFDIVPALAEIDSDGRDVSRIKLPGLKLLRAGNEYQFFEPARPGDLINRKRKIIEIYERESKKLGKIIFIVYEITYNNQKGKLLGLNRETLIFFK
jgi:acyl dehydratase